MIAATFAAAIFSSAHAQSGSTSSKIIGAWEVVCSTDPGKTPCALLQQQAAKDAAGNRQRLLALELRPDGDKISGTVVLPFGLDLAKGIKLSLPGEAGGRLLPFKTCLPAGCLVDLSFGPQSIKALSSSKKISVVISPLQEGGIRELSIMLEGFSEALATARAGKI